MSEENLLVNQPSVEAGYERKYGPYSVVQGNDYVPTLGNMHFCEIEWHERNEEPVKLKSYIICWFIYKGIYLPSFVICSSNVFSSGSSSFSLVVPIVQLTVEPIHVVTQR